MKILAFTDIHGSLEAIKRVSKKIKEQKPELLICAGDISVFESSIFSIFKKLNSLDKKIIMIHGNHEDASTFVKYSKRFTNIIFIHKKHFVFENVLLLGFGGGGFSMIDKDFEKTSKKFKNIIKENSDKKIILVTHAPPYKTKLDNIDGEHCGNKSIRKFAEKNKVDFLICGHLHENFGKEDKIRKTIILNPGPFGKIVRV